MEIVSSDSPYPSCDFSKGGLRQLLIQFNSALAAHFSVYSYERSLGKTKVDTYCTVPLSARSACLQPAGATEAFIEDLVEAASQILAQ